MQYCTIAGINISSFKLKFLQLNLTITSNERSHTHR